jgi:diguanylate cyclase (GGDEF)-like protein
MGYRIRDRLPMLLGAVAAVTVALVGWLLDRALLEVWAAAMTVLLLFLTVQLALERREGLQRERRLVRTAAALREATAQLERLASVDTLTGVRNRRMVFEQLGVEFRRMQRYGRALSVMMIDIDHFKALNDAHGHPLGDVVLAEVARLMQENLRESDVLGRYGGEEFLVVLPETDGSQAAIAAEKLRRVIEDATFAAVEEPGRPGVLRRVTISIGIASTPVAANEDEQALVEWADAALYEAKRAGRNRVHLHGHGVTSHGAPVPA